MSTLLTGGSGVLGRALRELLPDLVAPSHEEFDVQSNNLMLPEGVDLVVHAAAYTDLVRAETERDRCYAVNVLGTTRVARLGVPVVYISTAYVFDGDLGDYGETDARHPLNWYARTKMTGEDVVRGAPRSLVIRTIFKDRPFKHERAIADQLTSGDYVDQIAPMIAKCVTNLDKFKNPHDTVHVGTRTRTTYELALESRKDVKPITLDEVTEVKLPRDVTLDLSYYDSLFRKGDRE